VTLLDVHATVIDAAGLDADGRGRSLFGSAPRETCITEYHGLNHRRIAKLREADVPSDRLAEVDQTYRGIALQSSYSYETPEGFVGTDETGRDRLADLTETLDVAEPTGTDEAPSEDVLTQLEDLGYA